MRDELILLGWKAFDIYASRVSTIYIIGKIIYRCPRLVTIPCSYIERTIRAYNNSK